MGQSKRRGHATVERLIEIERGRNPMAPDATRRRERRAFLAESKTEVVRSVAGRRTLKTSSRNLSGESCSRVACSTSSDKQLAGYSSPTVASFVVLAVSAPIHILWRVVAKRARLPTKVRPSDHR